MKYILVFLLATGPRACLLAQQYFVASGKVVDAVSQQPLSGASVFCQNTTIGTVSAADGRFTLRLPNGGYDLIVSYTGYQTEEKRINTATATDIQMNMKQKDKALEAVAVVGSNEVPDGLVKYGTFFAANFIGNTNNAVTCKIQNPAALQFFFSKKRNRLKVKAKEDLIIVNEALGYKIKYQLDSFVYEYGSNISIYSGFPFYEEMVGDALQEKKWKENRQKAYKGSRLHFMRSWYDRTLARQGFEIERVESNTTSLATTLIENEYDSSFYLQVENRNKEISYNGKLRVVYKNEVPEVAFLVKNNLPTHLQKQFSIITIDEGITIEPNGYFYDQNDVFNAGYWAWEKLADAMPYDYKPDP